MGNEQSQIPGINIDEKVIEVSDFWSQHRASIFNDGRQVSNVSIFIGDLFINEPLWSPATPLEKFSKNLMIYRHPCIIKYISSWQRASKFYLAVEEVIPLSHLIMKMNSMEICLGLYSVLKTLCFLHQQALVSHNNVCLSSIFVTKEGSWKLGGMEYLCKYKDLGVDYLKQSKKYRYSKGIDSNEESHLKHSSDQKDFIDTYAYCMLANELLKNKTNEDIPSATNFRDFCKNVIQNPDVLQRPRLCSLLEHDFFKNRFINIHSYLIELPLKTEAHKTEFFSTLKDELLQLDEEVVASQLGGLLVSRMVLLNKVAQRNLIPYILVPRNEENDGLFCEENFTKYIAPKLTKVICVRDAQIRLLLLEYFSKFQHCFSKEDLQSNILPELLVGIKDTNNDLVAATLRTLADLVPLLGAQIVIGGKRAKLFNDGRPKSHPTSRKTSKHESKEVTVRTEDNTSSNIEQLSVSTSMVELIQAQDELPERPRPDGEEEVSTDEVEQSADEDLDNWEDWDNEDSEINNRLSEEPSLNITEEQVTETESLSAAVSNVSLLQGDTSKNKLIIKSKKVLDINELDIKNQTKIELEENDDFFRDMEPVIITDSKFVIPSKSEDNINDIINSKLSVNIKDENEDGWGDSWE